MPEFWIIAGANGSGKSTAISKEFGAVSSVEILNPDAVTLLVKNLPNNIYDETAANLFAVTWVESVVEDAIRDGRTIGVETVLSSNKYERLIYLAIERGFTINMVYVMLGTAADNEARVKIRVAQGGHSVLPEKIISRRIKSLDFCVKFFPLLDYFSLYDNSGNADQLLCIATKTNKQLTWIYDTRLPELRERFVKAGLLAPII